MRSSTWRLALLCGSVACARGSFGPVPASDDRVALRHAVDSMLAAPEVRSARWGVLIVDPERGDTLYSRDAGKLLIPASNMKIITSAVALDALGPEFRFATRVLAGGDIRDGVLAGDLFLEGRGDPSVSDRMAGDAMLPLRAMADSLIAHGVRRVRGRLLASGNAFPDANAGFQWGWEDLETSSGALIDELLFNEGIAEIHIRGGARPGDTLTWHTTPARTFPPVRIEAVTIARGVGRDSVAQTDALKDTTRGDFVVTGTIPAGDSTTLDVTFRDPSHAYLSALREALLARGVVVESAILPLAARLDPLFSVVSAPLSEILAAFMKPSQNQLGEILFKTVALQATDTGTARIARRITGDRLRGWGAAFDGFLVWDGSGLSRRDLISPETIVKVLDAMRRGPHFQVYFDAMPVAGVDGTLRGRMRGTRAEANVRGKTGTLGNVRSLSGFVTTASGRQLIFSVLCNNYLVPTDYITRVQDSIGVRLARLRDSRGGS